MPHPTSVRRTFVTLILCITPVTAAYAQTMWYVDQDATGSNDGTTWDGAFTDLQDALAAASAPAEIWVAGGIYRPAACAPSCGDADREQSFTLIDGVALYGGFAGDEMVLADRAFGCDGGDHPGSLCRGDADCPGGTCSNATILSGDINGDDGWPANNGDNSYHVVWARDVTGSARLDGFVITGGNASNPSVPFATSGGGLTTTYFGGYPTIANCLFVGNRANDTGGAIRVDTPSGTSMAVVNCAFLGNWAVNGGGVRVDWAGTPMFTNCLFGGNGAQEDGGGMYVGLSSVIPTIVNCTFSLNSVGGAPGSSTGGGLYAYEPMNATVANCVFWGNTAPDGGPQTNVDPSRISYSCVPGWVTPGVNGNIDADPLFVDPAGPDGTPGTGDDNLRLSGSSPCIDAGSNVAVPGDTVDLDGNGDTGQPTPVDLDGNPRFRNDPLRADTGLPDPEYPDLAIVDMGAYEFKREDCDANGTPDECDADCGISGCDVYPLCGLMDDCNNNGFPDICDINVEDEGYCEGEGCSADCQPNDVPDECEMDDPEVPVESEWDDATEFWDVQANWCPSLVPDNSVNHKFEVVVDAVSSIVTLDVSPTVNLLSVTDGATILVGDGSGADVRSLAVGGTIINVGRFLATDRERFVLDAPVIDQTGGGILEASDGVQGPGEENDKSILEINGSLVMGGVARATDSNSEIHLIGGAELQDVTVEGVVVPDGQTGGFSGALANEGVLQVGPNGSGIALLAPGPAGAVLLGVDDGDEESVHLGGETTAQLGHFSNTFTNSANHVIAGAGILFGSMTNDGVVRADKAGEHLIIFPPGQKTNNGTFLATEGGTLRVSTDVAGSGNYTAVGGTIKLEPAGASASITGSSLDIGEDGVVEVDEDATLTIDAIDPIVGLVTIDSLVKTPVDVGVAARNVLVC